MPRKRSKRRKKLRQRTLLKRKRQQAARARNRYVQLCIARLRGDRLSESRPFTPTWITREAAKHLAHTLTAVDQLSKTYGDVYDRVKLGDTVQVRLPQRFTVD